MKTSELLEELRRQAYAGNEAAGEAADLIEAMADVLCLLSELAAKLQHEGDDRKDDVSLGPHETD